VNSHLCTNFTPSWGRLVNNMGFVLDYSQMKDSGYEWIGMIPNHWQVVRLQSQLHEVNENNDPIQTTQILSLTNKLGVVPYEDKGNLGNKAKEDLSGYKIAYPDCIVANSMNILIGSVGLSHYYGCVSPVYYVFGAREGSNIKFINYLFSLPSFQKELRKYANGILEIRLRVSAANILKQKVALPPIEEQSAIVDYLDAECEKIDLITAEARDSIDDYKRWKTSIISEAVTKGVHPNVSIRDSGNDRIGLVPAHWAVRKMKTFIQDVSSGLSAVTSDTAAEESGKYVLRTSSVSTGVFKPEEVKSVLTNAVDRLICPVERDTLIMSRMNTASMVGYCAYIADDYPNYYLPDKLWKIHTKSTLMAQYAWFLINAPVSHDWFASVATGTSLSMLNISLSDFYNLVVAVPPIDEQKEICAYLEDQCNKIDACISEKQALISDLESYKKSLIYEVVTGKRKVV